MGAKKKNSAEEYVKSFMSSNAEMKKTAQAAEDYTKSFISSHKKMNEEAGNNRVWTAETPTATAPAKQTNSPRPAGAAFAAGTVKPVTVDGKKATGKAADSGYSKQKAEQQQAANRQTVKDWWKREQQKAAEDDSTERARTAKLTGGANIDNSKEFLENTKKTFGGIQDDADTQRKRALQSKMGVGANWGNPKTAVGNAVESAAAGTTASLLNALGTVLQDDGKRQGLAVDSGAITDPTTTGNEWYNRAGRYLQSEADKVQKISDDAYTRGSEGLTNAQKLLFDVGIAGAQMLGDKAFGVAAPIVMAARGFGSGSMQARQEGATHTQQVLYGAASAAVEALTEKMFDGVAHVYGKGAADDVVQKVAEKLAKTPQGQSVVRALMNAGGEGLEEMISAIVDPALQTIYNDKVINGKRYGEKGAYDDVKMADILYDGLIGALLGFAGGAVDVAQTMRGAGADSAAERTETAEHEKSSPLIEESGAAEAQKAEAPAAAEVQQKQAAVKVPRLLTPEEQTAKRNDEEVERIIEAFTTDDGYVGKQKQNLLIYHHGEDLFYRAVREAFSRGLITNDGSGNIYSLKAETRAPGYYGAKGKETKYLDSLAKAANMVIIRGDLNNGEQGFYINGRAVLAADAGVEIARHEVAHHLKQAAPEEFDAFMEFAKSSWGNELESALEIIRNDYAAMGESLSDEVAQEELAAFFAGKLVTDETAMRRLAGENLSLAERLLDWIRKSLAKVGRALGMESTEAKRLREGAALFENAIRAAKNGTAVTDGAVRHAIETLPDGKRYVRADRQVIFGNDPESWKEQLQSYINGKIRNGQDVTLIGADGDELVLTSDSTGKLSSEFFGDKHGNTRSMSEREYERKVNAATHIDELLQVSVRGAGNEPDVGGIHGEAAANGWNYRTAYFQDFDKKYYKVTISTMVGNDAVRVYNVGKMQERSIPQVRGSSAQNSGAQTGNASSATSIPTSTGKSNTQMLKEEQFRIIQQSNPAEDSYHTWVRSVDDIRTLAEVVADPDWDGDEYDPDYTRKMAEDAIKRGKIKVYSSKPIGDGIFVTPSRMEAESYSSNGKVYSKVVGVDDVAWIDPTQGQYAPVGGRSANSSGKRSAYNGTAEKLDELQRLQRQNERLNKMIGALEHEVRLEKAGGTTDREATKKLAKDIMKRYGSKVDVDALTGRMVDLYDRTMRNELSQAEMKEIAQGIARYVMDGSVAQINTMYEEYEDLRKELRGTKLKLEPEDRADLDRVDGYENFRKRNMGRFILSNNGVSVDAVYEGLSERYPSLFPDDIYTPADQLIQIADVLDEMKPVMGNPFEGETGATQFLANDILESFFDIPTTRTAELQRIQMKYDRQRQADREATDQRFWNWRRRMEQQRQADRAAADKRFAESRQRQRERINDIMQKNAERERERRAKATATERRTQLMKGTERLTKKLVRPDDKRHIPAEMRETVRAFVSMVNTESGYEYVFQRDGTYKRVKAGTDPYGMSTARTDRARELMSMLDDLQAERGGEIDPQLKENLKAIEKDAETKIADMDREQIDRVYEVMRSIEKMCQNYDKMLGESKYATVSKAAEALRAETAARGAKTQYKGALQAVDDLAELDMMTPETFFHKMGKTGDELYRQMRRSADKQTRILAEGVEHAKKAIEKSGLDLKKLEHETHEFELESGEHLTMTTAQIMELHELWKRKQAQAHIGLGGIKPTKIDSGKGLKATAAVRAEKVTLGDLSKILSVLTNEQKALADNLQKFMAGGLAVHGNEASRMVYGYDKFTDKDYWPIHVNKAEVKKDHGKEAQAKTIVGFGMAKSPMPESSNGLEIGSFLDTYTKHLSEMATYAGWLATSENLTRINNFQFLDGQGGRTGETVKTILEKLYGKGGDAYWQKLMGDIAQGTKTGSDGTIMDKITGNTKAAAVGANLRVILQQPTSILRAMNMVHPKYFAQKNSENGWEKALKYSGIAKWKDWGYFEMDTGRSVRGLITGPESKVEQLRETSMAAAGKADSVSWGILWNAVENETKDRHPELNGEALYEATAERFGEVIDRTQVVDSVLHRSQIMRKGGLNKMATSFMSEPSKVYNMVLRDIYDVSAAEGEAKTRAKKRLARTAGTLALSFAANAVAQSIVDAMRDDDREKDYWEKFAANWVENFADNFNALNYIPYVKDIVSVFSGYDVSRMDMDAIADARQAADQLAKAIKGTGKKTVVNAGMDAANEIAAIFGLPTANIKRDLLAAVNTVFSEARLYRMQYELDKVLYNIDYTGSRVRWWKILHAASKDNWEDYVAIYNDMIAHGIPEETIKKGMENQMKADAGVSSVKELPYRWTPPTVRSEFNHFSKQISETEGPRKALDLGWW